MMWKAILAVALLPLIPSSVRALDPSTAISQYAHTAWRNRDGYFASAPSAISASWNETASSEHSKRVTGLWAAEAARQSCWE